MNRNIAGKAIPKHTIGMCTASDSACICRAWTRSRCAPIGSETVCASKRSPPIHSGDYPGAPRAPTTPAAF